MGFYRILVLAILAPLSLLGNAYVLSCYLDEEKHTIACDGSFSVVNQTSQEVRSFYLHLYPNAFQEGSTFSKEASWLKRYKSWGDERFSRLEIHALRMAAQDLLENARFIAPDDGNPQDKTLLEVPLPLPLRPGEEGVFKIAFTTHLHRLYMRSGYGKNYYQIMQWYPKVAPLEEAYQPHQFHAFTEFYGPFSEYTITLDLPEDYTLVSTGSEKSSQPFGKDRTRHYLHAERVHDFAMVTGKGLKKHLSHWRHTTLTFFLPDEYGYLFPTYEKTTKALLDFMASHVSPYPYENLTVVCPPWGTSHGREGMEYPTLVVVAARHHPWQNPLELDYTLAHELIHQYFYGILASNEVEEPWLDEGFTTYWSVRFMGSQEKGAPMVKRLLDFPIAFSSLPRSPYLRLKLRYQEKLPIDRMGEFGYQKADWTSYRIHAYAQPALFLKTLENFVGTDALDNLFQSYYERFAFSHPKAEDFLNLLGEKYPIWEKYLKGLLTRKEPIDIGIKRLSGKKILCYRQGPVPTPLTLRITFQNGKTQDYLWKATSSWSRFTFPQRVIRAELDPEGKFLLDANPFNNLWEAKPSQEALHPLRNLLSQLYTFLGDLFLWLF